MGRSPELGNRTLGSWENRLSDGTRVRRIDRLLVARRGCVTAGKLVGGRPGSVVGGYEGARIAVASACLGGVVG